MPCRANTQLSLRVMSSAFSGSLCRMLKSWTPRLHVETGEFSQGTSNNKFTQKREHATKLGILDCASDCFDDFHNLPNQLRK